MDVEVMDNPFNWIFPTNVFILRKKLLKLVYEW